MEIELKKSEGKEVGGEVALVGAAFSGAGMFFWLLAGVLFCGVVGGILLVFLGAQVFRSLPLVISGFLLFVFCGMALVPVLIAMTVAMVSGATMSGLALWRGRSVKGNASGLSGTKRTVAIVSVVICSVTLLMIGASAWNTYYRMEQDKLAIDKDYIHRVNTLMCGFAGTRNKGRYPERMSQVAMENWPDTSNQFQEIMQVPQAGGMVDLIPLTAKASDWPAYADAIDEASDYRYVGSDLEDMRKNPSLAGQIVVLYDKHSRCGGRMVGFADRSVRFVKNSDLGEVFVKASEARGKLGLPAITMDGPAPRAKP